MRYRITCLSALGIIIATTGAQAQVCLGAAPFSTGNMRVGAGATFGDNAKSYGVQFSGGAAQGTFGGASLSTVQYDDVPGSGTAIGASVGMSLNLVPAGTAQICPIVGFDYQNGPNINTGFGKVSVSAHAFSLGGSLGGVAMSSPGLDFVPFVSAAAILSQASASLAGDSESDNQNYGEISAGAGFVINRVLTLQPAVHVPVGLDGGKASFSIAFGFNFGNGPAK
jgi:hypothetical protein